MKPILTSKFSKQRQFCPFCRKFWFVYSFETKTNHECLTTGEQVHLYYLHDDDLHRGLSNSGLLQCLLSHGKHFYRIFIVVILSQHGWDCVLIITFIQHSHQSHVSLTTTVNAKWFHSHINPQMSMYHHSQ